MLCDHIYVQTAREFERRASIDVSRFILHRMQKMAAPLVSVLDRKNKFSFTKELITRCTLKLKESNHDFRMKKMKIY